MQNLSEMILWFYVMCTFSWWFYDNVSYVYMQIRMQFLVFTKYEFRFGKRINISVFFFFWKNVRIWQNMDKIQISHLRFVTWHTRYCIKKSIKFTLLPSFRNPYRDLDYYHSNHATSVENWNGLFCCITHVCVVFKSHNALLCDNQREDIFIESTMTTTKGEQVRYIMTNVCLFIFTAGKRINLKFFAGMWVYSTEIKSSICYEWKTFFDIVTDLLIMVIFLNDMMPIIQMKRKHVLIISICWTNGMFISSNDHVNCRRFLIKKKNTLW